MDLYVSADEAAAMLGVDVRTLYTYVSRKKLRTLRTPGERQTRYWREDVEQLAKLEKKPAFGSPLVAVTQISLITREGPFYRGHSAVELSRNRTLEDVARILWQAPTAFTGPLPKLPRNYTALSEAMADHDTSERAHALLPLIERANPKAFDFSPEGYARTGADVVRTFAAIVSETTDLSDSPIHEFIGSSIGVGPDYQDLIRRALILGADHELEPTTYAVRALANTGVSPYAIALTGLAAFSGRRLRIGRVEQMIRLVGDIMSDADPSSTIVQRFRSGEQIPGFGGGVYKGEDPRASAMLAAFEDILGGDEHFRRFKAAISVAHDLTGEQPDFMLTSIFLRFKLGTKAQNASIVAVGRLVGWIAHAMEQYHGSPLVRPRAAYNGILPGSVRNPLIVD